MPVTNIVRTGDKHYRQVGGGGGSYEAHRLARTQGIYTTDVIGLREDHLNWCRETLRDWFWFYQHSFVVIVIEGESERLLYKLMFGK